MVGIRHNVRVENVLMRKLGIDYSLASDLTDKGRAQICTEQQQESNRTKTIVWSDQLEETCLSIYEKEYCGGEGEDRRFKEYYNSCCMRNVPKQPRRKSSSSKAADMMMNFVVKGIMAARATSGTGAGDKCNTSRTILTTKTTTTTLQTSSESTSTPGRPTAVRRRSSRSFSPPPPPPQRYPHHRHNRRHPSGDKDENNHDNGSREDDDGESSSYDSDDSEILSKADLFVLLSTAQSFGGAGRRMGIDDDEDDDEDVHNNCNDVVDGPSPAHDEQQEQREEEGDEDDEDETELAFDDDYGDDESTVEGTCESSSEFMAEKGDRATVSALRPTQYKRPSLLADDDEDDDEDESTIADAFLREELSEEFRVSLSTPNSAVAPIPAQAPVAPMSIEKPMQQEQPSRRTGVTRHRSPPSLYPSDASTVSSSESQQSQLSPLRPSTLVTDALPHPTFTRRSTAPPELMMPKAATTASFVSSSLSPPPPSSSSMLSSWRFSSSSPRRSIHFKPKSILKIGRLQANKKTRGVAVEGAKAPKADTITPDTATTSTDTQPSANPADTLETRSDHVRSTTFKQVEDDDSPERSARQSLVKLVRTNSHPPTTVTSSPTHGTTIMTSYIDSSPEKANNGSIVRNVASIPFQRRLDLSRTFNRHNDEDNATSSSSHPSNSGDVDGDGNSGNGRTGGGCGVRQAAPKRPERQRSLRDVCRLLESVGLVDRELATD